MRLLQVERQIWLSLLSSLLGKVGKGAKMQNHEGSPVNSSSKIERLKYTQRGSDSRNSDARA